MALIARQAAISEAESRMRKELADELNKVRLALDAIQKRHEAERAYDRHKIANLVACLNAAALMLENNRDPEVRKVASAIRQMRSAQMQAEALERAKINGAAIMEAEEAVRAASMD